MQQRGAVDTQKVRVSNLLMVFRIRSLVDLVRPFCHIATIPNSEATDLVGRHWGKWQDSDPGWSTGGIWPSRGKYIKHDQLVPNLGLNISQWSTWAGLFRCEVDLIRQGISQKLCKALKISGPFNIQFICKDPWQSRRSRPLTVISTSQRWSCYLDCACTLFLDHKPVFVIMLRQSYKRQSEYIGLQLKPLDCHITPVPSNILSFVFFWRGGWKQQKLLKFRHLNVLERVRVHTPVFGVFFPE